MIFSLLWFLASRLFGAHKVSQAMVDAMVASAEEEVLREMGHGR